MGLQGALAEVLELELQVGQRMDPLLPVTLTFGP